MKKHLAAIVYALVLTAFTTYITLDTFVLTDAYQVGATEKNTSMFANVEKKSLSDSSSSESSSEDEEQDSSSAEVTSSEESSESSSSSAEAVNTSNTYKDDNISITLKEYYENNTKIYVADVQVTSAEYLKTAFANDTYGKNVTETTSSMAASNNAVLAINGDYYGARESGYVIRNGVVYRDTSSGDDIMCIYADGTMKIVNSDEKTAQELVDEGVWQALCFGPGLVENSEVTVTQGQEVGKAMASNPRTAIGMIDSCHYVFVVSDGRTSESQGLSLYQLATFMQGLGVTTAYNLDGGGSSTMYFNGQVVNNPTTHGGRISERSVSDIVYIGE